MCTTWRCLGDALKPHLLALGRHGCQLSSSCRLTRRPHLTTACFAPGLPAASPDSLLPLPSAGQLRDDGVGVSPRRDAPPRGHLEVGLHWRLRVGLPGHLHLRAADQGARVRLPVASRGLPARRLVPARLCGRHAGMLVGRHCIHIPRHGSSGKAPRRPARLLYWTDAAPARQPRPLSQPPGSPTTRPREPDSGCTRWRALPLHPTRRGRPSSSPPWAAAPRSSAPCVRSGRCARSSGCPACPSSSGAC
jgi:hypothetical protein